jgi:hypothetical protein
MSGSTPAVLGGSGSAMNCGAGATAFGNPFLPAPGMHHVRVQTVRLRHPGHRCTGLLAFRQHLLPQRGWMLAHLLACRVFHRVHDRVVVDTRLAGLLTRFKMGCPDAHTASARSRPGSTRRRAWPRRRTQGPGHAFARRVVNGVPALPRWDAARTVPRRHAGRRLGSSAGRRRGGEGCGWVAHVPESLPDGSRARSGEAALGPLSCADPMPGANWHGDSAARAKP